MIGSKSIDYWDNNNLRKEAFPSSFWTRRENKYIENRKRGTENGKSISAY